MSFQTCFLHFNSIKDYSFSVSTSGTVILDGDTFYCITSLSPLIDLFSCDQLNKFNDEAINHLSPNLFNIKLHFSKPGHNSCGVNDLLNVIEINQDDKNVISVWKSECLDNVLSCLVLKNQETKLCCHLHGSSKFYSWFLLINVGKSKSNAFDFWKYLSFKKSRLSIKKGMEVYTSSFPFNTTESLIFHDCISKGIICNIIQGSIIITDARCLPGSEGGALYSSKNLIGIIISSIILISGGQTGFSIVCLLNEVKSSYIKKALHKRWFLENLPLKKVFKQANFPDVHFDKIGYGPNVVVVTTISSWGTGVLAGIKSNFNGFLLTVVTCKHVVKDSLDTEKVKCSIINEQNESFDMNGYVVYKSNSHWLDFAVVIIKCSTQVGQKLLLSSKQHMNYIGDNSYLLSYEKFYFPKQEVLVKAYTLFDGSKPPFITKGIISKVAYAHNCDSILGNLPVLIHSTCIVLSGASGGAFLSKKSLKLLGLVVSNVKEVIGDSSVLYSNISFILPAVVFMPAVTDLIKGNINWYSAINKIGENFEGDRLWNLKNSENSFFNPKL